MLVLWLVHNLFFNNTLIGIYPTKGKLSLPIIVMEKMQFSLRELVEKDSTNITWNEKLSIVNDVCNGLEYLHSRNPPIIHRDLTPNNILLCYHLRAKITDLGVAKVMQTTDTTNTLTQAPGTQDFMPPESLTNKPVYGLPLDIFSFGGVMLYICIQQWPELAPLINFDPDTGKRIVLTELQRRQQYLDKMVGVYTVIKPLVLSCLDDNPKNRPSAAQALLEIKRLKCVHNENMYHTKLTNGQLERQKIQMPHLDQHKQDQKNEQNQKQDQQQEHQLQNVS